MNSYRVRVTAQINGRTSGHTVFVEGVSTPDQASLDAKRSLAQHLEYQDPPVIGAVLTVTTATKVSPR